MTTVANLPQTTLDNQRISPHTSFMSNPKPAEPLSNPIDRRTFIQAASLAGLTLAAGCKTPTPLAKASPTTSVVTTVIPPGYPKRFCIVGTGGFSPRCIKGEIEGDYKPYAQLVGICDKNPGRLEYSRLRPTSAGPRSPRR